MSNEYFQRTSPARDFELVQNAFDKLPALAGNGGLPVFVNPGGTALTLLSIAQALTALGAFSQVAIQSFTSAGANTYTPTSGMKYCIVISTGAGGGGGGSDTDGGAGHVGVGGGGGAGATCIEFFTSSQIGTSQTVTIGTGGTAGSATGGTSGNGGSATTFGSLHTAGAGGGGIGSGVATTGASFTDGGNSGTATGGTVNINGANGEEGIALAIDGTTDGTFARSGAGAPSFWGGGGRGRCVSSASLGAIASGGVNGVAPGSGGSGALTAATTTGNSGGTGANGICVVIEFL